MGLISVCTIEAEQKHNAVSNMAEEVKTRLMRGLTKHYRAMKNKLLCCPAFPASVSLLQQEMQTGC